MWLELDHDGVPYAGFVLPQIGAETCSSGHTSEAGCGGEDRSRHERSAPHHRSGAGVRDRTGVHVVSGRDSPATCPVGYICMAIAILCTESDVLSGHPVEGQRTIPGFVRIAGVLPTRKAAPRWATSCGLWSAGR